MIVIMVNQHKNLPNVSYMMHTLINIRQKTTFLRDINNYCIQCDKKRSEETPDLFMHDTQSQITN